MSSSNGERCKKYIFTTELLHFHSSADLNIFKNPRNPYKKVTVRRSEVIDNKRAEGQTNRQNHYN